MGGSLTETVLWTISDTATQQAEVTVTLSQSIDNFKYIVFKVRSYRKEDNYIRFIFEVNDIKKSVSTSTSHDWTIYVGGYTMGTLTRRVVRGIIYLSPTQLKITIGYSVNNGTSDAQASIIAQISGLS